MPAKVILFVEGAARISGLPLDRPTALVPVLGRNLLDRVIADLRAQGLDDITVLSDCAFPVDAATNLVCRAEVWPAGEELLEKMAEESAEALLLVRVDSYFELDLDALIAAHTTSHHGVTQVYTTEHATDIYMVDPQQPGEALFLLRNQLRQAPAAATPYILREDEYFIPLADAAHFRQLALDGLYRICRLVPAGTEVRPGVWHGQHVRVDRTARVVAPAFLGAYVHVYAGCVLTEGAVLEDHVAVDCGTVVQDSTVLPQTRVGLGLELVDVIAASNAVFHLRRNAVVEVEEPKLLSTRSANAVVRTGRAALSLLAFLPVQIVMGLRGGHPPVQRVEVPAVSGVCSDFGTTLKHKGQAATNKMLPGLAVMRRYGNE